MTHFLPEVLLRHAIGLDALDRFAQTAGNSNYPPHNIEQLDEDRYRLTLAVAGFTAEDLVVTLDNGALRIEGRMLDEDPESPRQFLHRGIGFRPFSREFKLGEHVEVIATSLQNGLLVIDLERHVPEERKPRRLMIQHG